MRARRVLLQVLSCVALAALAGAPASQPLGAQSVPTPESVLGFVPGADFHLATYEQSLDYFQKLAAASDRVQLERVGTTSEGRPWYVALISSADNLKNVEHYRDIAHRLAYPGDMSDAEAHRLAAEGKAIVHIDGGLHATEVAPTQHTIQLAYDLVTGDSDPKIKAILDNVILVLWFSINPDGQTMVADWYKSNLGTPFEVSPTPFLYQKYIAHDNNRDGYMLNMIESRTVTRTDRHWEPEIIYNHHQTAPFPARIWIPPFADPVSPNVHPLMWREVNLIGMAMAEELEEHGQRGAVHMGTGFDDWYPGFIDHANSFHNVASLLTETGLYRYATPHFYTVQDFPTDARDLRPQSLYASPWEGGWWRLGDAVAYCLTASKAVLDVAAKFKVDFLYNRYQAAHDVTAEYRSAAPLRVLHRRGPARSRGPGGDAPPTRVQRHHGEAPHLSGDVGRRHPSGGHLGDSHGSAQRELRAPALLDSELPGPAPVSRRPSGPAVRRLRLDASVPVRRARSGGAHAPHRRRALGHGGRVGRSRAVGRRRGRVAVGLPSGRGLRQQRRGARHRAPGREDRRGRRSPHPGSCREQHLSRPRASVGDGRSRELRGGHGGEGLRGGRQERLVAHLGALGRPAAVHGERPPPTGSGRLHAVSGGEPSPRGFVPTLVGIHRRGMDTLAPGDVRREVRQPLQRRCPRREAPRPLRRHRPGGH